MMPDGEGGGKEKREGRQRDVAALQHACRPMMEGAPPAEDEFTGCEEGSKKKWEYSEENTSSRIATDEKRRRRAAVPLPSRHG